MRRCIPAVLLPLLLLFLPSVASAHGWLYLDKCQGVAVLMQKAKQDNQLAHEGGTWNSLLYRAGSEYADAYTEASRVPIPGYVTPIDRFAYEEEEFDYTLFAQWYRIGSAGDIALSKALYNEVRLVQADLVRVSRQTHDVVCAAGAGV